MRIEVGQIDRYTQVPLPTPTDIHTHRPTSTLVLDSQGQGSSLEMQFLNNLEKKKKSQVVCFITYGFL